MNTPKRSAEFSIFEEASAIKKAKSDGVKPPLPKELTKLFQPLFCVLCKSQLSSPVTAAGHYSGKPHQKKVTQYLSQNFPELLPKEDQKQKSKNEKPTVVTSLTQDQASMCKICNVVFAGPIAAQSHYSGKKHRSKVLKGYVPIEAVSGMYGGADITGRFGIGETFRKPTEVTADTETTPEPPRSVHKWYCDICNIQATDDTQYKTHLVGKKHLKNVGKMNLIHSAPTLCPKFYTEPPKDSILNSVTNPKHGKHSDHSTHRTPSGEYYCEICDIRVNSVAQYTIHIESKKHKKKKSSTTSDAK